MRLRSGIKTSESSTDMGNKDMQNINRTVKIGKYEINYTLLIIHLNIFLYSTCFWIQLGVFPYLSANLGTGSVMYGYLQTTFAVVQLCGGPIFGRFGDLYGGRAALTLAFVSSAVSYGILGFAGSIPMLFISRLPSLTMHAMQGGQMVVTDMADSEKRVTALGKLSISYGIGMVLGPILGGQLAKYFGLQSAALVACAGSVVSAVVCYTQIPNYSKRPEPQTLPEQAEVKEQGNEISKAATSIFNPKKYLAVIKHERAFILLLVRFITGIPIGIFQSMFPIVAKDLYGLTAEENGYVMSYIGILSMLIQGVGMGVLKKKFSEIQLIKLGVFILVWAYFAMIFVQNIWQLAVVMAPLVFGLAVLTIVISAALTNSVDDKDTGVVLGINMAVNSMVRAVSPTMGGYILEWYGFSAFGYIGCVDSVLMTIFLLIKFRGGESTT